MSKREKFLYIVTLLLLTGVTVSQAYLIGKLTMDFIELRELFLSVLKALEYSEYPAGTHVEMVRTIFHLVLS